MAEPLVISFAAATSRAQGAMATLASQIVGNMTAIAVAMSGGAANSNGLGASPQGLANNAQRAAAAVGPDVRTIASATANAATADKATLEGVVRAVTGAAVSSNTAGAALRTGLSATTGAAAGVAAQIPSLNTLLAVFLGFEAAKIVFDSVAASIEAAREHSAAFVRIGREAEKAGVSAGFFQRATRDAEKFGLTVEQVVAALQHARAAGEIRIGEGKDGANASAIDARLTQNVRAGNLSAADKAGFDAAGTQEAKIRAMLDLIDKLRADQRDLAAFDLAGHFFGPDFDDAVETLVKQLEKARDTARAELETVGKTNVARETAVALAKAEAAAREDAKRGRRADPALGDDERARVLSAAEAMQRYRDATEDAQQALRQSAEAARFFAQTASDGLADAIVNGKSLGSVLTDITKQLERSMLSGLLTGTGPLAGLLGTAPLASAGSNAAGGLLGSLFGGLFRANGGPVAAGRPVTVGEMGRELFVPNTDGTVIPVAGGAASGPQSVDNSRSYAIDARGAQAGVAEQITAALGAYDRGLNRTLAARTAVAGRRYGTGR